MNILSCTFFPAHQALESQLEISDYGANVQA
jgi:hypothetical protein